jgi:hypothetical protein
MLRLLRQTAIDVGLVDSARHGDDNDGGDGGVLLFEEGIERHTIAGVVNNSIEKRPVLIFVVVVVTNKRNDVGPMGVFPER